MKRPLIFLNARLLSPQDPFPSFPRCDTFASFRGAKPVPLSAVPAPVSVYSPSQPCLEFLSQLCTVGTPPAPFQEALEFKNIFIMTLGPYLHIPSC